MIVPGDDDDGRGSAYAVDEQLTLSGEEDTLPWLASDDEEEEEQRGSDYRIVIFAVLALLVLGGLLYGAKRLFDGAGQPEVVADGSTIEAPEGDYKERPANPGGQAVAGTGDLSYEVGEGVAPDGLVSGNQGTAQPSVDLAQAGQPSAGASAAGPSAAPAAGPSPRAPAAASGGVGVQVGAYQSRESAETGWTQLAGRYSALQGVGHRVIEGRADSGTVYRLQAVAGNLAAADALCRSIRSAGGDCQVKR
jgi:hypothetical protein